MQSVKKFLQKWIINNIGFKILALVFAFVLWLVITNTTDPVTNRTITGIPVQIENEQLVLDGSHVYTVESGSTATVVVSGNRSVIGNLTAADFIATADFAELSITNSVPINVELTGEKARFASSVTITLKTNSMIINLEDMDTKTMNVEVEYVGQQPEDMIIEDAACNPAKVVLHAPESVINQAAKAAVQINYSEVTGDTTLHKDVVIYDHNGNAIELNSDTYLESASVDVKITTSRIKSVPIYIEAFGTPAADYVLTDISFSKETVSLRGSEDSLGMITDIVLPQTLLNIQAAKEDVSITVNIQDYLPQGVTIYGDTGTVTITATISPIEADTEDATEEETTDEG
ncbi:MAG: CdaR family protein [Lachnospiraceae bacterium]|nr:CdaR family protein [Lachnospiraceae bacterium]